MHRALAIAAVLAWAGPAFGQSAFETGVDRFRAKDFAGSVAPLEQAHASDPRDADTALLLGIAYYRTDRGVRAVPLLQQAERSGDDDVRASARVFLGLIADERGDSDRAQSYFGLVARSSTDLGSTGRLLLERGASERWSVVAVVRPGYDSNVALVPATATAGDMGADADLTVIGSLTVRPSRDLPLVFDETATYRREARLAEFSALGNVAGATYTLAGRSDTASLAYHFEASTLGGARYELGHVADAGYRHRFGALGLGARYTFAARDFAQDAYAGYSGFTHTGVAETAWIGSAGELAGGYVVERTIMRDPMLASLGQGGRAALRLAGHGLSLHSSVVGLERSFDGGRRDLDLRGDAALYIDLAAEYGLVFGATAVRNISNDADFDYLKWTAYAGVVIGTGR